MRVYSPSYWLVIFCTTNSSRVLARERWQTFENSWKLTQYLMNILYNTFSFPSQGKNLYMRVNILIAAIAIKAINRMIIINWEYDNYQRLNQSFSFPLRPCSLEWDQGVRLGPGFLKQILYFYDSFFKCGICVIYFVR